MKNIIYKVALFFFFISAGICIFSLSAYSQEASSPPDGSTMENAIVLKDLASLDEINTREQEFLTAEFGALNESWTLMEQEPLIENSRHYDKITVKLTDSGQFKTFYFDITQPFDKYNLIQEDNSLES